MSSVLSRTKLDTVMFLLTRTLHKLLIEPWLLLRELSVLKSTLNNCVVTSLCLSPGINHHGLWLLLGIIFVLHLSEVEVNDWEFHNGSFIFVFLKILP